MSDFPSQIRLSFTSGKNIAQQASDIFMAEFEDDGIPVALFETSEASGEWMVSLYVNAIDKQYFALKMQSVVEDLIAKHGPRQLVVWSEEAIEDIDWVSKSLENLEPVRAHRYIVHGTHDMHMPKPHEFSICIDAGQAFGTGHHGTTLGCLMAIYQLTRVRRYSNVLDLGTGSAVLAIAMAKTQPSRILATDIDPVAVQVADHNIKKNNASARIKTATANGLQHRIFREYGPFDLIIANILARPLEQMARSISLNLARGGDLILSGLLPHQRARIVNAYRQQGLVLSSVSETNGWLAIIMNKPKPH